MTRRATTAAALTAAVVVPAVALGASDRQVLLPSTATALDGRLPLVVETRPIEQVFPPRARLRGQQRVTVLIDRRGAPVAVTVRHRLVLVGTGDYSFVVPAPLVGVREAPGSESRPGMRTAGIVWQGFVNRRRTLAADAELRTPSVATALPLRIRLATTVDGEPLPEGESGSGRLRVALGIRSDTAIAVDGFDAPAAPDRVAPALDRLRRAAHVGRVVPEQLLAVVGRPRRRAFVVEAPFRVAGEIRFPGAALRDVSVDGGTLVRTSTGLAIRVEAILTAGRPTVSVVVEGVGTAIPAPVLALSAEPLASVPGLVPPGGTTWRAAVASGRVRGGRVLVELASRATLQLARVRQFDEFLDVPGSGPSAVEYRYRTAVASRMPNQATPSGGGLGDVATAFAAAGAALLVTVGIAVAWARL